MNQNNARPRVFNNKIGNATEDGSGRPVKKSGRLELQPSPAIAISFVADFRL